MIPIPSSGRRPFADPSGFCNEIVDPKTGESNADPSDPTCWIANIYVPGDNSTGWGGYAAFLATGPAEILPGVGRWLIGGLSFVGSHVYLQAAASDVLAGTVTGNLCGQVFAGSGAAVALPFIMDASVGGGIIVPFPGNSPPDVMSGSSGTISVLNLQVSGNRAGFELGLSLSPSFASAGFTASKQVNNGWCK